MKNYISISYKDIVKNRYILINLNETVINRTSIWIYKDSIVLSVLYKILNILYLAEDSSNLSRINGLAIELYQYFNALDNIKIEVNSISKAVLVINREGLEYIETSNRLERISYLDIYSFYNWKENMESSQVEALYKYNISNRPNLPFHNDRYTPTEARILSYLSVTNRSLIINSIDFNIPDEWLIPLINDIINIVKPTILAFSFSLDINPRTKMQILQTIPFSKVIVS